MGAGSRCVRMMYSKLYVTAIRTDMRLCMYGTICIYVTVQCIVVHGSAAVVELCMKDIAAEV